MKTRICVDQGGDQVVRAHGCREAYGVGEMFAANLQLLSATPIFDNFSLTL
jgi:hypothetical protein